MSLAFYGPIPHRTITIVDTGHRGVVAALRDAGCPNPDERAKELRTARECRFFDGEYVFEVVCVKPKRKPRTQKRVLG